MSTNALFAVRRVLQHPAYCARPSFRPPLRALHGSALRWAVEAKKTPSAYATASRHPFAEGHGGGGSPPKKEDEGKDEKEKEKELAGDPSDPGSRPKIGPFSKPVEDDGSTAPTSTDAKSAERREAQPEVKEDAEDHHEHPELRTRTGPHSAPVQEDAPPPAPKTEPPPPAPQPPAPPKPVVKGPATGPSSSPPVPLEVPQELAIPPLPPPSYFGPAHQFDTYRFVQKLEGAQVRNTPARVLMEGVRGMLVGRSRKAQESMLSQQELDNQAYRFKAALSALRTEISIKARNDGLSMRAASTAMQREVEGLDRKMTEDLQGLRHDIEMELNTRKDDTRALMKRFDIATEEINNKFTISLGELRTEIESAKWEATRRAIAIIITLVICGVAISTFTSTLAPPGPPPLPQVQGIPANVGSSSSSSSSSGTSSGTSTSTSSGTSTGTSTSSGAGTSERAAGGSAPVKKKTVYKDAGVGPDYAHFEHFDADDEDNLDLLHDDIDALLEQTAPRRPRAEKAARVAEEKKRVEFPERI